MIVKANTLTSKEMCPRLKIGAFTFVRDDTGRVVLHVDVESGLYPLRLTHEQTLTLAKWLRTHQEDEMACSRTE